MTSADVIKASLELEPLLKPNIAVVEVGACSRRRLPQPARRRVAVTAAWKVAPRITLRKQDDEEEEVEEADGVEVLAVIVVWQRNCDAVIVSRVVRVSGCGCRSAW